MGLLFRPRCPHVQLAGDAASYRVESVTGTPVADLDRIVREHAHLLVGDPLPSTDGCSVETQIAGDGGWAEWVITGGRVTVRGVTVADFDRGRIEAVRHYWDELGRGEDADQLPRD